jgi:hypothetical protein
MTILRKFLDLDGSSAQSSQELQQIDDHVIPWLLSSHVLLKYSGTCQAVVITSDVR